MGGEGMVVPLHFSRSGTLIGSSLGGLSLGGSLGVKFRGSSTRSVNAIVGSTKFFA